MLTLVAVTSASLCTWLLPTDAYMCYRRCWLHGPILKQRTSASCPALPYGASHASCRWLRTPIVLAAANGHADAVQALVEDQADIDVKDK